MTKKLQESKLLVIFVSCFSLISCLGQKICFHFPTKDGFSGSGSWLDLIGSYERDPVEVLAWPRMVGIGRMEAGNSMISHSEGKRREPLPSIYTSS